MWKLQYNIFFNIVCVCLLIIHLVDRTWDFAHILFLVVVFHSTFIALSSEGHADKKPTHWTTAVYCCILYFMSFQADDVYFAEFINDAD